MGCIWCHCFQLFKSLVTVKDSSLKWWLQVLSTCLWTIKQIVGPIMNMWKIYFSYKLQVDLRFIFNLMTFFGELTVNRPGTKRKARLWNAATESQCSHFLISPVTILVEVFSHPRGRKSQQRSCSQNTETEPSEVRGALASDLGSLPESGWGQPEPQQRLQTETGIPTCVTHRGCKESKYNTVILRVCIAEPPA